MNRIILFVFCLLISFLSQGVSAEEPMYWYENPTVNKLSAPQGNINVKYAGYTSKSMTIGIYKKKVKQQDCVVSSTVDLGFDETSFQGFSLFSPRGGYIFFYMRGGFENSTKLHYIMDTKSCKIVDNNFILPYFDPNYSVQGMQRIQESFFWTKNGKQIVGMGKVQGHIDDGYEKKLAVLFVTSTGSLSKRIDLPVWKLLGYSDPMKLPNSIQETIDIHSFSFDEKKKKAYISYTLTRIVQKKDGSTETQNSGDLVVNLTQYIK